MSSLLGAGDDSNANYDSSSQPPQSRPTLDLKALYGRNRQSIADIEQNLHEIIISHPKSSTNEFGDPVIPADSLPDVFKAFAEVYNGVQLMSDEEMEMLKGLLASNPGLEVTPQILLQFVAEKTKGSPPRSPNDDEEANLPGDGSSGSGNESGSLRGRRDDRDQRSRSSSVESNDVPPLYSASRRSSLGPPSLSSPASAKSSPFDAERRQRTRPLTSTAPSSWNTKRPAPASRQKSDAGRGSDSESGGRSRGPSRSSSRNGSRNTSRTRGPSNPTSPSPVSPEMSFSSMMGSPNQVFTNPGSSSRPHSRAQSQPHLSFNSFGRVGNDDRERMDHTITSADSSFDTSFPRRRGRGRRDSGSENGDDSFLGSMNSLSMPRLRVTPHRRHHAGSDADSDSDHDYNDQSLLDAAEVASLALAAHPLSDGEDDDDLGDSDSENEDESSLGLVMERSTTTSNASMEPFDRVDILQKANTELGRKLMEAEKTLQMKLGQHEADLEDMQMRLDGMEVELSAMKREEKELRSKERQNMTQISALESEVAKVTKLLENARTAYTSMQRNYQEQLAVSEKYRDDLRYREELIRNLQEAMSLHEVETLKWGKERENWEERMVQLESELMVAQQAHALLDEQKQENMLLKETIDRMKFEMDEMRSGLSSGLGPGGPGGVGSANNTISKSLGAELMGKMKWGMEADEEEATDEKKEDDEVESVTTAVEEEQDEEDVIQTIITRKTRKKIPRKQSELTPTLTTFEELKEYSDASTQYEPEWFSSTMQTQTEPEPEPKVIQTSSSVQTETEPEPIQAPVEVVIQDEPARHIEMEIQTDPVVIQDSSALEVSTRSGSPTNENDESLASSSSTIIPPTPRAGVKPLESDSHQQHLAPPPSYLQVTRQEVDQEWKVKVEVLKKYHPGVDAADIPESVPESTLSAPVSEAGSEFTTPAEHDHQEGFLSEETVEEWKALKEELGVGCLVIDKIVENAERNGRVKRNSASSKSGLGLGSSVESRRRSGKFFNIYNTYVYGAKNGGGGANAATNGEDVNGTAGGGGAAVSLSTTLLAIGVSTLLGYALSNLHASQTTQILIPGGPTYYDRSVWNAFNTLGGVVGEGFAGNGYGPGAAVHGLLGFGAGVGLGAAGAGGAGGGWGWGWGAAAAGDHVGNVGGFDGTTSVWNFLERVGGGAARIVRGWPT